MNQWARAIWSFLGVGVVASAMSGAAGAFADDDLEPESHPFSDIRDCSSRVWSHLDDRATVSS